MSSPNQFTDGKSGVNRHSPFNCRFMVKFLLSFRFHFPLNKSGEKVNLNPKFIVAHSIHPNVIRLVSESVPSEFPRRHHQFLVRCHGDRIKKIVSKVKPYF